MSIQKVREKIFVARMHDDERNRKALARLKARMMLDGDIRLERQVSQIVEITTGVRP